MMKTYYVFVAWYKGEDHACLTTTKPCIDPIEKPCPCYWMAEHSIDVWKSINHADFRYPPECYPILWTDPSTQLWTAKSIDARTYKFHAVELDEDIVNMVVAEHTLKHLDV